MRVNNESLQCVLLNNPEAQHGAASLPAHLSREADKLERLVLAPAGHDVGEAAVGVLVERRAVPLVPHHRQVGGRQQQREHPVHKHQELRVGEAAPLRRAVIVLLPTADTAAVTRSRPGSGETGRASHDLTATDHPVTVLHGRTGIVLRAQPASDGVTDPGSGETRESGVGRSSHRPDQAAGLQTTQ